MTRQESSYLVIFESGNIGNQDRTHDRAGGKETRQSLTADVSRIDPTCQVLEVSSIKRQRPVSARALSRLFEQAAEAWKQQDYARTLDLLGRASRLAPANMNIQFDLGRAHGMRYNYAEAALHLDNAVRLASGKEQALTEAGRRCHEFDNDEMARGYFQQAVLGKMPTAEAFVALAELEERQAHLPEAIELTERALTLQPGNASAQLARARLDRLSGQLTEAEGRVRGCISGSPGDPWARVRAWYELGHILDRQGHYDEAMDAFLSAKALVRPAAANHASTLAGIQARIREMQDTIHRPAFERWAAAIEQLRPLRQLAILSGHPRSGTTLLEQVLDSHPRMVGAEETHILHDEAYLPLTAGSAPDASVLEVLDSATTGALRNCREDYFRFVEAFLRQPIGDRMLLDKNPALTVLIPAVARLFPEAKFLIALRDPRDVCLSCFMQPLAPNPVSSAYLTLEGTVQQYLSVMGFWCVLRPRIQNPFLEVRYEDLVQNLETVARRVLEFLGVDWDGSVLRFHEHARNKLVRSPSYAEVSKPITNHAVGRWQHYRRYLEPHLGALEPIMKTLGYL